MQYFLKFIEKQPKGYITQLADLQGLPYSKIYSAMTELRNTEYLSEAKKQMLVSGVCLAEAKEYKTSDFIW